ncbi:MAG: hypothetical protein ACJKTH_00505 [Patescibacteria group bacterium UBA2163]
MNFPQEKHTLGAHPPGYTDDCPFLWGPRYTRLRNKTLKAAGAVFTVSSMLGGAVASATGEEQESSFWEYSDDVLLVGGAVVVSALLAVAGFAEHRRRRAHRSWIYN